jgi:hypothetical protein
MAPEADDEIERVGDQLPRRRWDHVPLGKGLWAFGGAIDGAGGVWINICIDCDQITGVPQDPDDLRIQFHSFAPYAEKLDWLKGRLKDKGVRMMTNAAVFRQETTPGVPLMVELDQVESFAEPNALVMGPIVVTLLVPEALLEEGLEGFVRRALPPSREV